MAQRLANLPREKRELLVKLLANKARTIQPRAPETQVPLTYGQERLWVLDQIAGENAVYNECNFMRFPFEINVDIFRRAVNEVVRRHESLRTVIDVRDGEPFQRIMPSLRLDLPLTDLRRLPADERESEAFRLAVEEGRVHVDLTEGPLVRGSLFRIGDSDFLFALVQHHIISDGWSFGVMAGEISILYWSFLMEKPSPLAPLKIQYPDFAVWQRRILNDRSFASQLDYWRSELAHLPVLDLPSDRQRPRQFTFRGARYPLEVPYTSYTSLLKLCQQEQVTPQMLLLAVFDVMLQRYSGQDDIAVITPVTGRNRTELEPLIGFLINSLVIRTDLSGDPTFVELLARVREKSLKAYANQDVSFERLIEELNPVRDKSRNPVAQVAFQIFQPPRTPDFDPQYVFPFSALDTGFSKFDLTVQLILWKESLAGFIEYYADLYDASQIERMSGHFCRLLESALSNPHQPISELAMLSQDEQRQQLIEWNDTTTDYPRDSNIAEVFQQQAATHLDQIAVLFEDRSFSYRELDNNANLLAKQLIALGVRKGETVGLLMERCLEFSVAFLGIAKAGCVSVPLDPGYPSERLSYMIEDCGAKVLVTSRSLLELAKSLTKQALIVEEIVEGVSSTDPVSLAIEPDAVACLMYTSGTTGKPKGVAITHRNIVRLVKSIRYVSITDSDVIAQMGPINFDASLFEIWGGLLNGATVAVYSPGAPSLSELGAFIRTSKITLLFITTALFRQMIESNAADLRSVRQLITGGEVMPPALASAAFKTLPRTRLFNAYGPTECTTFSSIYPMTNLAEIGDNVPIGRPIENTTIYILDRETNLLPVGVVGEICIGGDGVANGYWNRPEITARSFITDPFTADGRLYRTGDLGKYRADGNILFLGRSDRQIKLSGHRIELAEVETNIAAHPAVTGVAAVITGNDDEKRLTAFLQLLPESELTYSDLRAFLSVTLPTYMIPSHIEVVEQLPLTANGKVDYTALSKRVRPLVPARDEYVAPQTRVEHLLVDLWHKVLAAERVGVTDNFFDLGGQSLVATRLLSRVRETFKTNITMGQFFDNPTVAGLAALVSANGESAISQGMSAPS
jgi:amino acid adenylation domain-containing protein